MTNRNRLGTLAGLALVGVSLAGCVGGRGGDVYYSEPVYRPAPRVVYQPQPVYQEPVYRQPRFVAQQPVYQQPVYVAPQRPFFRPPVYGRPAEPIYVPARPGVSSAYEVNPYTGQRTHGAVNVPQHLQRPTPGDAPN
jgi:hypothetical protein